MIFCGYAGVGKSTAAKKFVGVVDLESTPFQKDWETYARVAKHMSDQGYIVLLSCHKEIREELHRIGAEYIVVFPDSNMKEIYRTRYIERGNTEEFIKTQMSNWDKWVGNVLTWENECETDVYLGIKPNGEVENISNLIDDIIQGQWNKWKNAPELNFDEWPSPW